jgi:hypothetical protein
VVNVCYDAKIADVFHLSPLYYLYYLFPKK